MKLGARIFKTGIAIVLALFVSGLLGLPSPVFAGIAAVFAIQPTIYRSYLTVVEQLQANIIGAVIAISFVLLLGTHSLVVGLAAIVAIIVILKMGLENTIGLALVTVIAIMEVQNEDFIQFASVRFLTIMIGVLSAFIVNLIFLPPKYETKLFMQINQVTEDTLKWIRLSMRNGAEYHLLKKDISKIRERLIKIDHLYLLYKEDRGTLKKNITAKKRKMVLYRKMISSARRSFDILRRMNQFENEIYHLKPAVQKMMQDHLDCLMSYHEHLLLRYIGKVKPTTDTEDIFELCINREEFLILFANELKAAPTEEINTSIHMLHVLSSILEYGENLEHLDHLISSYNKFHHDDEDPPELEEEA
ncbi:FUSC family protein [Bacillus sp. FJAT-52991]|uniref:Aromatic acid exporter family protein n=1 Tax=Bacillus kandeliae TaxID=3129297 RepID=A0ABZ2N8I4_9BACI